MSTMLWLMRHGRATGQGSDAELLPEGEDYVRALGRKLRGEGLRPVAAFSSTFLRARDTADIVMSELSERPDVTRLRELTPDFEPEEAWQAVLDQPLPDGDVLVVSHLPLVGLLFQAPIGAQTAAQAPAEIPQRVLLTAGRSTVLTTDFDITRLAVTNPAIADAVVVKPREVLVDGKGSGTVSAMFAKRIV